MSAATQADGGTVARCSSCSAEIWFGLTVNRKRMPLDPQPTEDGNVVMDWLEQVMDQLAGANEAGPGQALPHVRVLRKGEVVDPDVSRYVSHFATCPTADRHRRATRVRAIA